ARSRWAPGSSRASCPTCSRHGPRSCCSGSSPAGRVEAVDNREVAEQLRQFADLLEIKGENAFRVNAYRRAADAVEREPEPLEAIIAREELTAIEAIRPGLAAAITEIVQTGRYSATEELLDQVPGTLLTLLGIPGVGPKTVGRLYRELGITTLVQLEAAARAGQVRQLKAFGPRAEARILEGIAFLHRRTNRLSIGTADPVARRLVEHLRRELGVPVEITGSVRRQCETVGNIDLLAAVESPAAIRSEERRVGKECRARATTTTSTTR